MILIIPPTELFAAKINALISRAAARDLYDINNQVSYSIFDESDYDILRKTTVFYAVISAKEINKTFNTQAIDTITFNKIKKDLFPVLSKSEFFDLEVRKQSAKNFINDLIKLTDCETEFLDRFENREYRPDLLFSEEVVEQIKEHPMALWKMQH